MVLQNNNCVKIIWIINIENIKTQLPKIIDKNVNSLQPPCTQMIVEYLSLKTLDDTSWVFGFNFAAILQLMKYKKEAILKAK